MRTKLMTFIYLMPFAVLICSSAFASNYPFPHNATYDYGVLPTEYDAALLATGNMPNLWEEESGQNTGNTDDSTFLPAIFLLLL